MTIRCGHIGYCTEQGLGHLTKDFFANGIITDLVLVRHRLQNHVEWYPPDTPIMDKRELVTHPAVNDLIGRVDVMLLFETPFEWEVLRRCRERGVRTVMAPMYEWWPKNPPHWPSKFACPSDLDCDIFMKTVGAEVCRINIPVDPKGWKLRTTAKRFLHNAGHIGHRQHKGTVELLRAMEFVQSDLTLTVRCQEPDTFAELVRNVPKVKFGPRITLAIRRFPREQLFDDHDVYVAPEKFNGLSLPLQEARAAGLVVMASDRYPANAWLPKGPLIPVKGYSRQNISGSYLEFDEALVDPKDIATKMDEWYGRDITELSRGGLRWAEENSWEALKSKWLEVLS